jgi:hypothetical protein
MNVHYASPAGPAPFSAKLDLVLRALSMSRGRLAAAVGVDKSLVGRWASGAVTPSEHNLANITRVIAEFHPGFTMIDWDREPEGLAGIFGIDITAIRTPAPIPFAGPADPAGGLPVPGLDESRIITSRRAAAYEGFWRTTRPSMIMPGRFFYDHGMIRRDATGLMKMSMGGDSLLFEGYLVPAEHHLYVVLTDTVGHTPVFIILNGVALQKAAMLEGLVLASALDAGRTPTAHPLVMERIGDLTGDDEADDAYFREILARDPVVPDGALADELRNHLLRDCGPSAAAGGGDLMLRSVGHFSRGATLGGNLSG